MSTEHPTQYSEQLSAKQKEILESLQFTREGLLPAIIQDEVTGEVLMLAWMDIEAVRRTVVSGRVTFWSRSRKEYWRKGDTSGHRQYVRSVAYDCDGDTLLVRVIQVGSACHTGTGSCFSHRQIPIVAIEPETARHDSIAE